MLKNPKWANFLRLIKGHSENIPIQVTWCDTSLMYKAGERVLLRPESNNFAFCQLVLIGKKKKIYSILVHATI